MRTDAPPRSAGPAPPDARDVVRRALLSTAFKPGEGWRKDGRRFGWILDTREVTLDGRYLPLVGRLIWTLARRHAPDVVAGTGVSSGPLLGAVLKEAGDDGVELVGTVVREHRKPCGRRRLLEGPTLPPGSRVVLLDDLASSGQTLLRMHTSLSEAGVEVVAAALLVDLERGARSALAEVGVVLDACYSLTELGIGRRSAARPPSFAPAWAHDVAGPGEVVGAPPPGPVVVGDRVVVGTAAGDLVVLDRDGVLLWRRPVAASRTPRPARPAMTATRDDRLVVGADDGWLSCVDVVSGEPQWRVACDAPLRVPPAVDAGLDLVVAVGDRGGDGGSVDAVSLDGRRRWSRRQAGAVRASPCVDAGTGTVVVGDDTGLLVAYELDSGAERWRRRHGGAVTAGIVARPGLGCCFGSADGVLRAVSVEDGELLWSRTLSDRLRCTPLLLERSVVLGGTSHLVCLDVADGEVSWWLALPSPVRGGGAALDEERVVFGCADGTVLVVDLGSGQVLARADVDPIRSPVVADAGLVVVSCLGGFVHGLRPPARA